MSTEVASLAALGGKGRVREDYGGYQNSIWNVRGKQRETGQKVTLESK